ncbi:MAG TPA: Cys-tRNA(Pro) deacylase, partial [Actinoplanes sp.]|nr:Cys-tRNA(Pro) deacylase [Actinoplanes sp.]
MAGRGTPATALLAKHGVPHTLHPYEHDPRAPSYGEEAATALGVDPARLFKTRVATVDGALAVGVVPVTGSL